MVTDQPPSQLKVPHGPNRMLKIRCLVVVLLSLFSVDIVHGAKASRASEADWGSTLRKAQEEGNLTVYGSSKYDQLFARFQKQYPEIKVTIATTRGSDVLNRLMTERRAGRYLVDLHAGSATASHLLYKAKILDLLKPALLLPEVTDESKWWGGKHRYLDTEGEYIFSFDGESQMLFAYNTNLVNPGELKSLWDFLDPKWKGKIVALDPTSRVGIGVSLRFIYYNPEIGPPFLRKLLGEMELAASRNTRQIGDWLAVGKYALSVFTDPTRTGLDVAKHQGLPVDWFGPKAFREGVPLTSSTGNVALLNQAPHPNAARIAINWLLSKNGQTTYQSIFKEPDSLRIDIPKDKVPRDSRRTEDIKYIEIDRADRMDMEPIFKIVNEVWKKDRPTVNPK
jgi:iron(III) transport system substrate-binding protein